MRLHIFQHVPFETPARIADWAKSQNFSLSTTRLFEGEALPELHTFDLLVVMGGPMGVHDKAKYPWLEKEIAFVRQAIEENKSVLGVCLGAQIIAHALGGKITNHTQKEIGWFPVEKTSEAVNSRFFATLPQQFLAFHWHGETFEIPEKARWIAKTAACPHQAFEYEDRVLALQYHFEMDQAAIERIVERCAHEIVPGKGIQTREELLSASAETFQSLEGYLYQILDAFKKVFETSASSKP